MKPEAWVVIVYHEHEPSEVYGVFFTETEAIKWVEGVAAWDMSVAAWEVKMIGEPKC